MTTRSKYGMAGCFLSFALVALPAGAELSARQTLGKRIFFDANLSEPAGQSCASCHTPAAGFAEPDTALPVSEGAVAGRFGVRNAPTATYQAFTPAFVSRPVPEGGQFIDGRAADLVEQAKAPFLNPREMNNPDRARVVEKLRAADYAWLFRRVYGPSALDDVESAYQRMAEAIADYERSGDLNRFSSKYDHVRAGTARLSAQEERGLRLFTGAANCAGCHVLDQTPGAPHLFSDFRYRNIGVPRNPEFPFDQLPEDFRDRGLGAALGDPVHDGKFKTPHLRNVARTAPYMHNGVLKTLKDVVHFYNTRDIPGVWPPPEVPENVIGPPMGNLGLSEADEDALVAFLMTLTDGYSPFREMKDGFFGGN